MSSNRPPLFQTAGRLTLPKMPRTGGGGVGGGKVAEEWGDPKKVGFCKQQRGGVLLVWVFFLA